jgi:starch synthase (maltosyl-transferring)
LDIGGAERVLWTLARGLARKGHCVEVACLTGHGKVGEWLASEGIPVHYLDARVSRPWSVVRPLRHVVRAFRPDVLHNFLFHANLAGRYVGSRERVPAVVCAVRVEDVRRPWRLWLDGWTRWMMHAETCVSESARQFTHRKSRIPLGKLITIPNCVEVSRFDLPRGQFRSGIGIAEADPLVVSVGRLERQKGTAFLLAAATNVLQQHPRARFVLVGDGPDESALKAQAGGLGIRSSVHFVGWRPDVPQILADADVFVLASLWEGMPNVVLEAMAARCAVLATSVGGCPELVVDGETGLMVGPGDAAALAEALHRLLSAPEERRRMGDAGRTRAETEFGPELMIGRYEGLYERLLAGAAGDANAS